MEKTNQYDKEEDGKDGTDDATHVHLLLVRDEGRGNDVGHQEEVDGQVEDQQGERVLVLPQKATPIHWLGRVKELQKKNLLKINCLRSLTPQTINF